MEIILNNRRECFEAESMSVSDLLKARKFSFKMLIIKINGKLIKSSDYPVTLIREGDEVTVLHLISGG